MGRLIAFGVIVAVLSAFIGYRIIELQRRALFNREIGQNHLPNCELLKGLEYGSEDITILPNGLAIISTGLVYPGMPSFSDGPGKIFMLDLEAEKLKPVELRIGRGFDIGSFNPHGISIYTDEKDQSVYLFVVNHPEGKSQVEIFQFVQEENSIMHLKTIRHELLHSPKEVKVVADIFYSANGINISPDNKYVYVSDVLDHAIKVMEIQENKALHLVKSVPVGSLCDNIEVDGDTGDLLMGCHPNGAKFIMYNPEDPPGSEVIRIQNIHSEKPIVSQVFADNGSLVSASSVATPYNGKLLIGSVFHKALFCDLK
ncbi:serum paraoxonase/arylesterase 2-like isoform X2 [Anguilla rostrata]|uniref:serum paraoxonase/arylesterase 2-like isoform X2 n=1 Tax=Anguilla rostrata TaxID=7938 RepID=UPI0030D626FC